MLRRMRFGLPIATLVLAACAPVERPAAPPADMAPPTAAELRDAMSSDMLHEGEDGSPVSWICSNVRHLSCTQVDAPNRFLCRYTDDRRRRVMAVVERRPQSEWEYRGMWRWISGPRRCGMLY